MYEEAINRLKLSNVGTPDASDQNSEPFAKSLSYYNEFEHQQTFAGKPPALKELLNQTFTQGQIHQFCPSAYP